MIAIRIWFDHRDRLIEAEKTETRRQKQNREKMKEMALKAGIQSRARSNEFAIEMMPVFKRLIVKQNRPKPDWKIMANQLNALGLVTFQGKPFTYGTTRLVHQRLSIIKENERWWEK